MTKFIKNLLASIALIGISLAPAHAESQSISMPGDAKLVVFSYDENNTFTVLSMPGNITDIQLNDGEKVTAMAMGDSVQWITARTDNHIFIKPTRPNIFTSATLVTDQRTYQLTLRASPEGGKWYQRVSWKYPELIILKQTELEAQAKAQKIAADAIKAEEKKRQADVISTSISKVQGNPVESLNFDYTVQGGADFKPTQVLDDGKVTYLRMNKKLQEWPATFIVDENNVTEVINPLRDGEFIKVTRLFKKCILKLNDKEVTITNNAYPLSKSVNTTVYGVLPWQNQAH
jgi:type IV secretion system protein VirB9